MAISAWRSSSAPGDSGGPVWHVAANGKVYLLGVTLGSNFLYDSLPPDQPIINNAATYLFAGGYLRGHLTLAVAELDAGEDHSAEALYANVTSSLEKAISAGELSPRDQALVKEMWDALFQKATQ